MLRQNGIRFYKLLHMTIKLAPDLKESTVYMSRYNHLNKGYPSILTTKMLRTYNIHCDTDEHIIFY